MKAVKRITWLAQLTVLLVCYMLIGVINVVAADEKLSIYTVNYPLKYFAERIAGEYAEVVFPTPANVDPAFWRPDVTTISAYQKADLILLNGANYAKWVSNVSLPRLRTVDTSRGFHDQLIVEAAPITHSHGPGADHSHSGMAFTTWLDPVLASQQAKAIRDALVKIRPDLGQAFSENFAALNNELLELDKTFKQMVAKQPRQPLLASHPVYQYFARRYDLNLESVLWEPDVDPSEADWAEIRQLTSEHPARRMLWEDKPLQETVLQLRQLAVSSVVFKPCANVPDKGDYMSVMGENVKNLDTAFPEFSIN